MPLSHSEIWRALDTLARREGMSPSGLARRAGLDATSFNPSKRIGPNERPRWPSTESLMRVLEVAGISLGDFALLADDGSKADSTIPLIGLAQAGDTGFFDDAGLPVGDGWDQTDLPRPGDHLFSLRITGDSMIPLYREGDRVIVDQSSSDVRKGDRVVARLRSGEVVAKEISAINARSVTLASINPAYPPRPTPRSEIDWMARIQWVSQ